MVGLEKSLTAAESSPEESGPEVERSAESKTRGSADVPLRLLEAVTIGLGLLVFALFVWVVAARFVNPIDAEWMTGSVRDEIERMRAGHAVYEAPSASYIPFLYTPIYYWISALVARVLSTFVACKVVSLAATGATAWGIWSIARTLGASRFWSTISVLLQFASFALTLFFYDLERVDALAAAVVVVGVAVLLGARGKYELARSAFGGAILGAAFFAKQPGLLAFVAAVVALFLVRDKKRGVAVLGAGGITFVALATWLEVSTGGWWRYYCVKLPRAHGVVPALVSTFFVQDLPRAFVLAIATFAVLGPVGWAILRREWPRTSAWREWVFAAVLAGGFAGAFFLRAHKGGWANVILAWVPLACAAVGIAATRAEERARRTGGHRAVRLLMLGGVSLQFLAGTYDPNENSPVPSDVRNVDRLRRLVRELEQEGEVVVTTIGNMTRIPHFHAAALFDMLHAGHRAPQDYLDALNQRRYAALVVGAPDEFPCDEASCREVVEAVQRNYFVALRLPELPRTGMAGYDGRPRWVLRPRKTPLASLARKALAHRQAVEAGLAESKGWSRDPDEALAPDDGIEDRAAASP